MNVRKKSSAPAELTAEFDELAAMQMLMPELIHQYLYDVKPLPPAQAVIVRVERAPGKPPQLSVKQPSLLKEGDQLFWTSPDARLEVRFSPALAPFTSAMFEVARGGKVYSGLANGKFGQRQVVRYKLLVTTPDGILLSQELEFTVLHPRSPDRPKLVKAAKKKG